MSEQAGFPRLYADQVLATANADSVKLRVQAGTPAHLATIGTVHIERQQAEFLATQLAEALGWTIVTQDLVDTLDAMAVTDRTRARSSAARAEYLTAKADGIEAAANVLSRKLPR